jgi:hypothetical protein
MSGALHSGISVIVQLAQRFDCVGAVLAEISQELASPQPHPIIFVLEANDQHGHDLLFAILVIVQVYERGLPYVGIVDLERLGQGR